MINGPVTLGCPKCPLYLAVVPIILMVWLWVLFTIIITQPKIKAPVTYLKSIIKRTSPVGHLPVLVLVSLVPVVLL